MDMEGEGLPKSDCRGSQKTTVISEQMDKYARNCRGKHQRSERTDSEETNKYRFRSVKQIYTGNGFRMAIHPRRRRPPKMVSLSDVSGLSTSDEGDLGT